MRVHLLSPSRPWIPAPIAPPKTTVDRTLTLAAADLPAEIDDEGYATAAAWKEETKGLEEGGYEDAGPPSPSSSGYAGERGGSLASSAGAARPTLRAPRTRSMWTRSLSSLRGPLLYPG